MDFDPRLLDRQQKRPDPASEWRAFRQSMLALCVILVLYVAYLLVLDHGRDAAREADRAVWEGTRAVPRCDRRDLDDVQAYLACRYERDLERLAAAGDSRYRPEQLADAAVGNEHDSDSRGNPIY